MRARGQVEQWLVNLEITMFDTVKLCLKKALSEYNQENFMEWMDKQYGQIALVVVQVMFTNNIEAALISEEEKCEKLEEYYEELKKDLVSLADHVKKQMMEYKRNVAVALIIILVHARDILAVLLGSNHVTINNFEWTRYYVNALINYYIYK